MNTPLLPHLTEKSVALAQEGNTYVFKVDKALNKTRIRELVEAEYGVEVTSLRTLSVKGKRARSIRIGDVRSGRRQLGKRKDFKKALVTLKDGDKIPVFTDFAKQEGQTA